MDLQCEPTTAPRWDAVPHPAATASIKLIKVARFLQSPVADV